MDGASLKGLIVDIACIERLKVDAASLKGLKVDAACIERLKAEEVRHG